MLIAPTRSLSPAAVAAPRLAGAPSAPAAPSSLVPAAAVGEIVVHRGERPPSVAAPINTPNVRFTRVYHDDMFSLQGLSTYSYSAFKPNEIKLRFENVGEAQLADAILKDVVLDTTLVYTDPKGVPYDLGTGYQGMLYNLPRAIAALPGVNRFHRSGSTGFVFVADSTETRVQLQQLVNRTLAGNTGYWKGECFGKTCPPDPKPPTGEV